MANDSHVDYKKLVQEQGKLCATPECSKKGKKPASEFNVSRDRYDGLQAYCRECSCAKQRAGREKRKEKEAQPGQHAARQKKVKAKAAEEATLREGMDLGDKLYAVPPSLCDSSLGSRG